MATTNTYSGNVSLTGELRTAYSVDSTGGRSAKFTESLVFDPAGGDAPTISGYLNGTLALSGAVDCLLAAASDPLQGAGDAAYSDGFSPAGAKIKLLRIKCTDATHGFTVARKATNGVDLFEAASDAVRLMPGDVLLLYRKAGGGALSTGSNDGLTLTPLSGSPTGEITVVYGP